MKKIARYTKAADQVRLARNAILGERAAGGGESPTTPLWWMEGEPPGTWTVSGQRPLAAHPGVARFANPV
jgi:hypothetical protein